MNATKRTAAELGLNLAAFNNSTVNSSAVDVTQFSIVSAVVTIASGGTPTGVIRLQGSNDGTSWFTEDSETFTTTTGVFAVTSQFFPFALARVQVQSTTAVAGTATAAFLAKGPK